MIFRGTPDPRAADPDWRFMNIRREQTDVSSLAPLLTERVRRAAIDFQPRQVIAREKAITNPPRRTNSFHRGGGVVFPFRFF